MSNSPTGTTRHLAALEEARSAVESAKWQLAVERLDGAGDAARSAEGLELRALAEYGAGRFEASVTAWEGLFRLAAAEGDDIEAARAAAMVALYLMMDTGLMAPVRGWLRRADRLVATRPDAPAHALIALTRTYERFMCGDMDAAGTEAARAIDLGQRLGVAPAVTIGRVAAARVTIFSGDVEAGLDMLDDVAVSLMSGEVDALTTGMMYCELICAAQGLGLHERATEWTEVMTRWCPDGAIGGIGGRCRVHRAEMLRLRGPCEAAEEEALRACDELRPWMRREFGWPLVELGNIRLRRGDLEGAEEAYLAAHRHAWSPHPGFALLRLEMGDVDSATDLITEAIAHPFDIPSKERPPFGDLRLAPLLEAQAEIAYAARDASTARSAADALATVADEYASGGGIRASAQLAAARAAVLEGDAESAITASSRSIATWASFPAPLEVATARTVLADAFEQRGLHSAAQMERSAAHDAFVANGARRWAERTAHHSAATVSLHAPAPTSDVTMATFACDGDTRTVEFAGRTARIGDLLGLRYLARLLSAPGREFHCLDLVAVEQAPVTAHRATVAPDELPGEAGVGLPVLDDEARDAYRRRLIEVEEDIDDAARHNDVARLELAERDRDYLVDELSRAVGLGGRHRSIGGDAERARSSVTRSIRYGLKRIGEHHEALARHLENCVNTGTYCSYTPDPLVPIEWRT